METTDTTDKTIIQPTEEDHKFSLNDFYLIMAAHIAGIPTALLENIMENLEYTEFKQLVNLMMRDNYNQTKIREIINGKLNPLERHAMSILNGDYCIIISEDEEEDYTTVSTTFYHPIEN